jgi:hypothetical protein
MRHWFFENLFNETLKDGVYFQTPGLVMAIAGVFSVFPERVRSGLVWTLTRRGASFLVKVPTFRNPRFYFLFLFLIFIPPELNQKTLVSPLI